MGGGKSGTSRICAYTHRKKTAEIKLHLTLALDPHAVGVRLVVAVLGTSA